MAGDTQILDPGECYNRILTSQPNAKLNSAKLVRTVATSDRVGHRLFDTHSLAWQIWDAQFHESQKLLFDTVFFGQDLCIPMLVFSAQINYFRKFETPLGVIICCFMLNATQWDSLPFPEQISHPGESSGET